MNLSEELAWRGFTNQTTYKDVAAINGEPITFYWGVDPSADSMTIGNLAVAMMVKHFINHGHKAILLVGGATGMIGDPDGKQTERDLLTIDELENNKANIVEQYHKLFDGQPFDIVDNYDWFKDFKYLDFLRTVGKHVPLRQMVGREFVQSRASESGNGISYAEFSYVLIQAYDFLYLHEQFKATLQVCGADQWGNSIAGVDLVRRKTGDEANVWSSPIIVNKVTGIKFGKSEEGAVWLDPEKTSPFKFYQFWLNVDDDGVEDYLKIYTMLNQQEITETMAAFAENKKDRAAQKRLAFEVTKLVHGEEQAHKQQRIAAALTGDAHVHELNEEETQILRNEIPSATVRLSENKSIINTLMMTRLADSNSDGRRLLEGNAVYIDNVQVSSQAEFTNEPGDRILLRRGKAFKDSALITFEQ